MGGGSTSLLATPAFAWSVKRDGMRAGPLRYTQATKPMMRLHSNGFLAARPRRCITTFSPLGSTSSNSSIRCKIARSPRIFREPALALAPPGGPRSKRISRRVKALYIWRAVRTGPSMWPSKSLNPSVTTSNVPSTSRKITSARTKRAGAWLRSWPLWKKQLLTSAGKSNTLPNALKRGRMSSAGIKSRLD